MYRLSADAETIVASGIRLVDLAQIICVLDVIVLGQERVALKCECSAIHLRAFNTTRKAWIGILQQKRIGDNHSYSYSFVYCPKRVFILFTAFFSQTYASMLMLIIKLYCSQLGNFTLYI